MKRLRDIFESRRFEDRKAMTTAIKAIPSSTWKSYRKDVEAGRMTIKQAHQHFISQDGNPKPVYNAFLRAFNKARRRAFDHKRQITIGLNAVPHETWAHYNTEIAAGKMSVAGAHKHFISQEGNPRPTYDTFLRKLNEPHQRQVPNRPEPKSPNAEHASKRQEAEVHGKMVADLYNQGMRPSVIRRHLASEHGIKLSPGKIAGHINRRVPQDQLRGHSERLIIDRLRSRRDDTR
jgi:hypothetical protein